MKKTLSFALVLTLLCGLCAPSWAEFSPRWREWEAAGVCLTLSNARLTTLNASSDEALRALQDLLSPLALTLEALPEGSAFRLSADGREITSLRLAENEEALSGALPWEGLRALFEDKLPALFSALLPEEGEPDVETRGVTLKNVGRTARKTVVTAEAEAFNAALLPLREEAAEALKAATQWLPHADELGDYLSRLTAEGTILVKRLETAEDRVLGWQLSGRVSAGGEDVRRLTVTFGWGNGGVYLNLQATAVRGNDSFKATLEWAEKEGKKENTLSGSLTVKRTLNKQTYSLTDSLSLKNALPDERVSGSVKRTLTESGVKSVWSAAVTLTLDGEAWAGSLTAKKTYAQTTVWEGSAALSLAEADEMQATVRDTEAEAVNDLYAALLTYLAGLSEADRRVLTHTLYSDAWLNGPTVPVRPLPEMI